MGHRYGGISYRGKGRIMTNMPWQSMHKDDGIGQQQSMREESLSAQKTTAGAPAPSGAGGSLAPMAQPNFIREYFPDTAYFNPSIITDNKGQAVVHFPIPDSLPPGERPPEG